MMQPDWRLLTGCLAAYASMTLFFAAIFFYRPFIDRDHFVGLAPDETALGAGFFTQTLLWQGVVWLPWVLVFYWLVKSLRQAKMVENSKGVLLLHLGLSGVVATVSLLWFRTVSIEISPFIGFETGALGVFLWFHVFWYGFAFLLYWATIGVLLLQRVETYNAAEGIIVETASAAFKKLSTGPNQMILKDGKTSHILKPDEIIYVEAQSYYSVLHMRDDSHWVKISLAKLQEKLDDSSFVRIHRSTLLNIKYLDKIKTDKADNRAAILVTGESRAVSRNGWIALESALGSEE